MRQFTKAQAQAMVEFALAATLLFFLLAAAIDLGFLFFTKQGMTSAAQEGAMYGSSKLKTTSGGGRAIDIPNIQQRVRYESGDTGGNGISNLLDLNSDGIKDDAQSGVIDPTGKTGYIQVRAIADTNTNGNPTDDTTSCDDPSKSTVPCYVYVTVTKVHNMFFPLSPSFGNTVNVTSSFYVLIRDTYRAGSGTQNFATPTPTPNLNQLVITQEVFATTFTDLTAMTWSFKAYDKGVSPTGTNGAGIQSVTFNFIFPDGYTFAVGPDSSTPYCVFGGSTLCKSLSDTTLVQFFATTSNRNKWNNQTFIVRVTALGTSGQSITNDFTTVYKK